MVNALLLRKELEYVTVHRDEWQQGTWLRRSDVTACGTVGCLAGNTVLHHGWTPNWYEYLITEEVTKDGVISEVQAVARDLLDLEPYQAKALFEAGNTLIELWVLANVVSDGEVEVPPDVVEEFTRNAGTPGDWWEGCNLSDIYVEATGLLNAYRPFGPVPPIH